MNTDQIRERAMILAAQMDKTIQDIIKEEEECLSGQQCGAIITAAAQAVVNKYVSKDSLDIVSTTHLLNTLAVTCVVAEETGKEIE